MINYQNTGPVFYDQDQSSYYTTNGPINGGNLGIPIPKVRRNYMDGTPGSNGKIQGGALPVNFTGNPFTNAQLGGSRGNMMAGLPIWQMYQNKINQMTGQQPFGPPFGINPNSSFSGIGGKSNPGVPPGDAIAFNGTMPGGSNG